MAGARFNGSQGKHSQYLNYVTPAFFVKTHIKKEMGFIDGKFVLRPRVFSKVQFSLAYLAMLNERNINSDFYCYDSICGRTLFDI